MSDAPDTRPPARPPATTAGGLLRQARQAQGLHIAALAAAIKVAPRKLESLEADRIDELPDATFARALAQSMCRTLKVDASAVLALLPPPNGDGHRLERVAEGLNTPFRERPGRLAPKEWARLSSAALWGSALLLLAAAVVYLLPPGLLPLPPLGGQQQLPGAGFKAPTVSETSADPAHGAPAPASAAPLAAEPAPDLTSPPEAEASAVAVLPAVAASAIQLRTTADSRVDVTDARGRSLLSRIVRPGETVALDGALPMKVRIGNARVTQLTFRGQAMELASFTRDNVARLELK